MPRPEKVQAVADIKERLEDSVAVFLAEYAGLSVGEQQQLRRGLRAAGGEFKIVKMTLARIAAAELGHDDLVEDLMGPTGLAFTTGDAAASAKVLRDFAKEHQQLILKGGLLDGEPLTPERIEQLADLDSREVLLAKVAGAFRAPMATMAGLMAALPRNLASMVSQLIEKLPPDPVVDSESEPAIDPEAEAGSPADEAGAEAADSGVDVGEGSSDVDDPEAEAGSPADEAGAEAADSGVDVGEGSSDVDDPETSDDAEATTNKDKADSAEEE